MDQGEHLAPRAGGAGALSEADHLVDHLLDAEAPAQRRDQDQSRVGDQPLVVELDAHRIETHGLLRTLHHVSDLLMPGRGCPKQPLFACSGGHFGKGSGRIRCGRAVD